jgi:hypothetical protein
MKKHDYSLLVEEFLKDKKHLLDENDSINIDLFISGDVKGWRFKNIPAPSIAQLEAYSFEAQKTVTEQAQKEVKEKETIENLKKINTDNLTLAEVRAVLKDILNIIIPK